MESENSSNQRQLDISSQETPAFEWFRQSDCQIVTERPHRMLDFSDPSRETTRFDTVSDQLAKDHLVLVVGEARERYVPLDDPRVCINFADINDETSLLRFIEQYGLPRRPTELLFPCDGTPVDEVLIDVQNMKPAVECLRAISGAEHGDYGPLRAWAETDGAYAPGAGSDRRPTDDDRAGLVACKIALVDHLRRHLRGVSLSPAISIAGLTKWLRSQGKSSIPKIEPRYTFSDLLGAMWFQIYATATDRLIVRDTCKQCGRAFSAKDGRQRYCTLSCRKQKNSQDYYARQREGGS